MICYIVLNYNDYKTTKNCVNSIKNYSIIDHIVIVDNMSTDNSYIELKKIESPKIDIVKSEKNGGYGYGNNYGIRYAKRKYNPELIVISNPDVFIREQSIIRCSDFFAEKKECSIVSLLMKNIDESSNYKCAWRLPSYWQYLFFTTIIGSKINFNYNVKDFEREYFKCDCIAGSWLMARTDDLFDIGLYDENVFLFCEETILALRAKEKNYNTYILPQENFTHMHSASISKTYKSDLSQQKLMWKSRLYVLENYYSSSLLKKILSQCFAEYALLERRLINTVRLIKRRIKSE